MKAASKTCQRSRGYRCSISFGGKAGAGGAGLNQRNSLNGEKLFVLFVEFVGWDESPARLRLGSQQHRGSRRSPILLRLAYSETEFSQRAHHQVRRGPNCGGLGGGGLAR